jgi:hypothetical protein
LGDLRGGNALCLPILEVLPRPTPAERNHAGVEVKVDEALAVHAATTDRLSANGLDVELFHVLTFT